MRGEGLSDMVGDGLQGSADGSILEDIILSTVVEGVEVLVERRGIDTLKHLKQNMRMVRIQIGQVPMSEPKRVAG